MRDRLRKLTYLLVVGTWFLFPLMLVRYFSFSVLIFFYFIGLILFSKYKNTYNFTDNLIIRRIVYLWLFYLFFLLIASIKSNSDYSILQWFFLSFKFLFLIFLITTTSIRDYSFLLKVYSYILFYSVLFSLVASIFYLLDLNVDIEWLNFLFKIPLDLGSQILPEINFFRIRGFSEEPGTFAFALFPAIFYFSLIDKRKYFLGICVIGLIQTMSFGAAIFSFLLSALFLYKAISIRSFLSISYLLFFICTAISCMYVISDVSYSRFYSNKSIYYLSKKLSLTDISKTNLNSRTFQHELTSQIKKNSSVTISGKKTSFNDRIQGVLSVIEFLKTNPLGAGTSLGMQKVKNSISVGYFIAAVDAGIIGGCIYFILFGLIAKLVILEVFRDCKPTRKYSLRLVSALSCMTVLFMGAQRMQPDLSFWHMWIYASMLVTCYLSEKLNKTQ